MTKKSLIRAGRPKICAKDGNVGRLSSRAWGHYAGTLTSLIIEADPLTTGFSAESQYQC